MDIKRFIKESEQGVYDLKGALPMPLLSRHPRGAYVSGGAHTREEWVEKQTMLPDPKSAIKIATT